MRVRVSLPTEEERTIDLEAGHRTYGDLLEAVGFTPEEATALVDGRPVPADRPIDSREVTVLRLIAGG